MNPARRLARLWDDRGAVGENAGQKETGRERRAAITAGTAVLARAAQISTSLLTVPLTIHYLGSERFGLWMTISSVLAMANFADFGIGNGVLNMVAEAFGKEDTDRMRQAISSGFAVLTMVGLLLFAFFASTFLWVSWADIFRVASPQARSEAAPALLIFALCFALNIPFDLVQRAQLGLQQGFRTNLWQAGGSISGLAGVVIAIHLHAGLPLLVAAPRRGSGSCHGAQHFSLFCLQPARSATAAAAFVSRQTISKIVSFGTLFFVLQLVGSIAFFGG